MVSYSEKNWDTVLEKWCATQEQAHHAYPSGHPVLFALDDLLLSIGDAEEYSACMSKYLRLVHQTKPSRAERIA